MPLLRTLHNLSVGIMFDSLGSIFRWDWIYSAFLSIAVLSTCIIIVVILSENRNPVKSLAWVTILLLFPVVGVVLYIFFGRSIKNKRMISRRNRRRLRKRQGRVFADIRSSALSAEARQIANLSRTLTGEQFYDDNEVEIFADGKSKFDALEEDLRRARHSINIQYYIVENDSTGRRITDILVQKVSEGVTVRLIYDHVGSFHVASRFFSELRRRGVQAQPFFKVSFPWLGTHVNWRNHRKICVIDNTVAYLGGMNIADRYITGGKFDMWRDTHMRITGPVVASIQYSFAVDWNFLGGGIIDDGPTYSDTFVRRDGAVGNVGAHLVTSGPTGTWSNVALAFQKAISGAKSRVYIQTPYFLPTESLLRALQTAALAHVDVRIMIPLHSDSAMLTHVSNSNISECLKAGVKIYRYKAGMLHSKMLIVDDGIVSIGSTNFDFRSFDYNFEANLFMYSRELNARATELFAGDMAHSERVELQQWRKRPLPARVAESVLRLLSPIL